MEKSPHDKRPFYFGVSARYFLNLQDDIDVRNVEAALGRELDDIPTVEFA